MLKTISTKLFSGLIISFCFTLLACHADAWNLSDKIPDEMPDNIRDILDKHYKNTSTFGSGINPGADQDILDYHNRKWGVSENETIKRYQSEDKRRAFLPAFRKYINDRIAGEWIQNDPEYKFVFSLKGGEDVPKWMKSITIDNIMEIEIRIGAKYTIEELLAIQDSISPMLIKEFPDLQGIGIDQKNNGISLEFYSSENKPVLKSDVIERLEKYDTEDVKKFLNMPIKINTSQGKSRFIGGIHPGGSKLYKTVSNERFTCTVGLAHQDGFNNRFFSSGGHCPSDMTFEDHLTKQRSSTKTVVKHWDEYRDYQLFYLNNGTPTNLVYAIYHDLSASKYKITSSEGKDQHDLGKTVCYNGIVSGFHCGEISDNKFKPNPRDGCGGRGLICASTWVKVDFGDTTDRCTFGDSGGPFWINGRAYGITSLAHFDDKACHYLVYMPIHYIWEDHRTQGYMSVLTTP